ncbi:glycosyltransferase [Motilimonas sp. KMU-193]|uniref:glycosyltransferase n=1 Tax=Motilimonas sp. KMU-193 TaxID=3388668 RepID=UPI00396B2779
MSLVVYKPNLTQLNETLRTLDKALEYANQKAMLVIIDHSPESAMIALEELYQLENAVIKLVRDATNPGFGAGHNRVLDRLGEFHLIINPDLEFEPDSIQAALTFMQEHPDCGLLTPYARWQNGLVQPLCKRYPSLIDLLLRGFAPRKVKQWFKYRLDRYELAEQLNATDVYWQPPIVSGCFMMFRGDVLSRLGGFDARFFLYFEDFDLSLRAGRLTKIAYVPQVRIIHHGGHASRKGGRHVMLFARSMTTFFNIHGWRLW